MKDTTAIILYGFAVLLFGFASGLANSASVARYEAGGTVMIYLFLLIAVILALISMKDMRRILKRVK